jgi:hypothetical protein
LFVWLIYYTLKIEAIHSCKASANSYQPPYTSSHSRSSIPNSEAC